MAVNKKSMAKRVLIGIAILLVILIGAGAWYINDYYRADETALAVIADENGDDDGIVVRELANGSIAFVPEQPIAGLIFYPGAKVQPEAYAPLLEQCAERGMLCVLVKPLFNLALLDVDAADGIIGQFPEVDAWYLAGHSMGGVAASEYLAGNEGSFEGIAFLASYPSADLSGTDDKALTLVGTDDQVINRDNLASSSGKLPDDAQTEAIEGGNHAYFGNYGQQAGDGTAEISREEQQQQTADALLELVGAPAFKQAE